MYTVDNKEVFYFLDRRSGWKKEPAWTKLEGYWSLIRVLAKILDFGREGVDKPYYEVDFTGNDLHGLAEWEYDYYNHQFNSHVYYSKRYFFCREDGSPIDVRVFEADVRKYQQGTPPRSYHYCEKDRTTNCTPGERLYLYRKYPYYYRAGSVPHTGCGWGHYTSPTQLGRHLRNDVTRPRLKPCPYDAWDGPYRHRDRSWKSSFKCKHQWEKHLIRRSKQNGDVWVQDISNE